MAEYDVSARHRLIGRDCWIEENRAAFQEPVLTFSGPGGVGKTSLARALAPEGSAWVELVGVLAEDVPIEIARQVGFSSFPEALSGLQRCPRLVVLDNCEHVVDALDQVVAELAKTGCRVWMTSRIAAKGIQGRVLVVPPLAPLDSELLLERLIHRLRFRWEPSVSDRHVLHQVAASSGGMPLALELLASAASIRTLAELQASLDTHVSRRHSPRHSSIRNVLEPSLSLAGPKAREAFQALSIFRSPFAASDAEALRVDRHELDCLVEGSLVHADLAGPAPLYHILEPLRELGAEQLRATEAAVRVQSDYCKLMLAKAGHKSIHLGHFQTSEDLDRLESRWPDFLAALDLLIEGKDIRAAELLSGIFMVFYLRRGRTQIRHWMERAIENCSSRSPAFVWLVRQTSMFFMLDGQTDKALSRISLAEAADEDRESVDSQIRCTLARAHVLTEGNRLSEALPFSRRLEELYLKTDSAVLKVHSMLRIGILRFKLGDLAGAESALRNSISFETEEQRRAGLHHMLIAQIRFLQRRFAIAARIWRRQFFEHYRRRYWLETATALQGFAASIAMLGEPDFAVRLLGAADALYERTREVRYSFFAPIAKVNDQLRSILGPSYDSYFADGTTLGPDEVCRELESWRKTQDARGVWRLDWRLAQVPSNERQRLAQSIYVVAPNSERAIFASGDPNDGTVYLAVSGLLERVAESGVLPVAPGSVIRDGALSNAPTRRSTLRALPGAQLIAIRRAAWSQSETLFRLLAVTDEHAPRTAVSSAEAEDRLFQYLSGFAPQDATGWVTVEVPLTQADLANRLGLARETVSRALGKLVDARRLRRLNRRKYELNL